MNADELPEGWAESTMGDIATVVGGGTPTATDPTYFAEYGIAWITPADLSDFTGVYLQHGRRFLTEAGYNACSSKLLPKGAVLMSSRAPIGYVAIAANELCTNQGFKSFVLKPCVLPEFAFHWLRFMRDEIEDMGSGSTFLEVSGSKCKEIPVRFSPLAEQRRIVAAVERILDKVTAARARLDRVPTTLKRFRQAVLAAACSGRLTADWRDSQPVHEVAEVLLQRICDLRSQRGYTTRAPRVATEPESDEAGDIGDDVDLPDEWRKCRVEEIATICLGGTPSRKEPRYWNGDVPWVSSGEVANCRIKATHELLTNDGIKSSNAKVYPVGTVLIAMIGEGKTRGQSAILDISAATNQNVAGLVFDSGCIVPEYVWFWALGLYERHRSGGRGGNYPALNGQIVRGFEIPLPPLPEQQEIVKRVSALFARADAIESAVTAARKRVDTLTQAVLAKAFRGELVPTEAELARRENRPYEPAADLLARLQSTATAIAKPTRTRKTKTPPTS